MAPRLPNLAPDQVSRLFDSLLENADSLLVTSDQLLSDGISRLGRSLAILGLEELGKAIAIFERRIAIAYETEGSDFVTDDLQRLWSNHSAKLRLVLSFLREEKYWFGAGDPYLTHHEDNPDLYLTTLEEWAADHNAYKQAGFYVDVSEAGEPASPMAPLEEAVVAAVVARVHQIGWQLRLGEHIESKRQLEEAQGVPPVAEDELAIDRAMFRALDDDLRDDLLESLRRGTPARDLHNLEYLHRTGIAPFENLGKPGYEAQTRELQGLWEEMTAEDPDL